MAPRLTHFTVDEARIPMCLGFAGQECADCGVLGKDPSVTSMPMVEMPDQLIRLDMVEVRVIPPDLYPKAEENAPAEYRHVCEACYWRDDDEAAANLAAEKGVAVEDLFKLSPEEAARVRASQGHDTHKSVAQPQSIARVVPATPPMAPVAALDVDMTMLQLQYNELSRVMDVRKQVREQGTISHAPSNSPDLLQPVLAHLEYLLYHKPR